MSVMVESQLNATYGDPNTIFSLNSQTILVPPKTKVYKYRWIILGLFMSASAINGFQWIQYSIISNVVQKYYNVQSVDVDWLSITFMMAYLPCNYPAMWLMDKKGLRVMTLLGSVLNCLAAWIKVASVRPDLFYVTFIGQAVAGVGQIYALNAPSRLAAVWFGQDQVSTACSLALFGNQIGVALGVLLPPIMVKPHDETEKIGSDLSTFFSSIAGICSLHLLLVIFFFRTEPALPPSPGQATRVTVTPLFFDSLKRLARNRGFVLLTIAYGLIMGVITAFVTVFGEMFLGYFPGQGEDAGRVGLTVMVAGMAGSVIAGFILDKTREFKVIALGVYSFATLAMLAFALTLHTTNIDFVFAGAAFLGFFMVAFLMVGYEFGAEITYPEPEGTTAGIINTSSVVFSILLTLCASALYNALGDVWLNVTLAVTLLIGTVITAFIKQDFRRQAAHSLGEGRSRVAYSPCCDSIQMS